MHGWLMRALGQAYILGRHNQTLPVYASETPLFQGMLPYAPHTATRAPVWLAADAVERSDIAEPGVR